MEEEKKQCLGCSNYIYRKNFKYKYEYKNSNFCKKECRLDFVKVKTIARNKTGNNNKGKPRSDDVKRKISESHKGMKYGEDFKEKQRKRLLGKRGKMSIAWKGGLTNLRDTIEREFKYRQWRSDIFNRDNFICQHCFVKGGFNHAHHIKYFKEIIKEYNIKNVEEALNCDELWNINNGITLCKMCHHNLHKKKVN